MTVGRKCRRRRKIGGANPENHIFDVAGGCCERGPSGNCRLLTPTVASPPSNGERLARHSLFGRYMKAQLRLAGDRRKLGRNGLSSDRPRECVDPPENRGSLAVVENPADTDSVPTHPGGVWPYRISARPARPAPRGAPSQGRAWVPGTYSKALF